MNAMNAIVSVTVLITACAASARAQSTDEQRVRDAVEAFLLHLGDHEFEKVAADLSPKSIVVVAREREGRWANTYQTGEEWLAVLKRNTSPVTFREPLTNVTITIDANQLAFLRADFQVIRDGKPQSRGVDQFMLVRESGAWRIAAIAYTSMPVP